MKNKINLEGKFLTGVIQVNMTLSAWVDFDITKKDQSTSQNLTFTV